MRPIEEGCGCYTCRTFTRAYVRHLINVNEVLGIRLLTLHNVHRYMEFMREVQQCAADGTLDRMRETAPRYELESDEEEELNTGDVR